MNTRCRCVVAMLLACLLSAPALLSQGASALFEQGLIKENAEGTLNEAIAIFSRIAGDTTADAAIRAKAQLHVGICYEKLGNAQARGAYERVIAEFPGQAAEVALARQKLAGLAAASGAQPFKPAFQRVTIPGKISPGAKLSPDGTRLAMVSESDDEIWVVTLQGRVATDIAGVPQRLSQGADAFWDGLTWSGNGQWLAFNAGGFPPKDICLLPSSGGALRKLSRRADLLKGSGQGLALSPDGRQLAFSVKAGGRNTLQVVSVESGEAVAQFGNPGATEPVFSPDGAYVAYVRVREKGREVRVVRLADRTDVQVAEATTTIRSPAWSPDGRMLAFLVNPDNADRGSVPSHNDLWITPAIGAGGAAGRPAKIALPTWAYRIAGWIANDRIGLLQFSPLHGAVYTVPLSGGKATQVTEDSEAVPTSPQWSPDGQRIYVRWMMGDVAFVPAGGGKVTVVAQSGERVTEGMPVGGNHVSPDGKHIVFAGARSGGASFTVQLWTMPVTGGEPVQLTKNLDRHAFQPRWSPDGKWIVFHAQTKSGELDENIFIMPSAGGEPRQLTRHADCRCALPAWSPGGDSIAYACSDKTIRVVPFRGGEPRTVLTVEDSATGQARFDFRGGSLAWTPDGSRLLYADKGRVWTVPASGGGPTAITTDVDGNIQQFALSPDGKTIAFNVLSGGDMELWMMEDFLPLIAGGK